MGYITILYFAVLLNVHVFGLNIEYEQKEQRFECQTFGTKVTERVEWIRNDIVINSTNVIRGVTINGSSLHFTKSERPRDEAEWRCRVVSSNETSPARIRYICPKSFQLVDRNITINTTRRFSLSLPIEIGPRTKNDISIVVVWKIHYRDNLKKVVLIYTTSPNTTTNVSNTMDVFHYDVSDFSIGYDASNNDDDTFRMSCSVEVFNRCVSFTTTIYVEENRSTTTMPTTTPSTTPSTTPMCELDGDVTTYAFNIKFLDNNISCFDVDFSDVLSRNPCVISIACTLAKHATLRITSISRPDPQSLETILEDYRVHIQNAPTKNSNVIVVGVVLGVAILILIVMSVVGFSIKWKNFSKVTPETTPQDSTHPTPVLTSHSIIQVEEVPCEGSCDPVGRSCDSLRGSCDQRRPLSVSSSQSTGNFVVKISRTESQTEETPWNKLQCRTKSEQNMSIVTMRTSDPKFNSHTAVQHGPDSHTAVQHRTRPKNLPSLFYRNHADATPPCADATPPCDDVTPPRIPTPEAERCAHMWNISSTNGTPLRENLALLMDDY